MTDGYVVQSSFHSPINYTEALRFGDTTGRSKLGLAGGLGPARLAVRLVLGRSRACCNNR